MCKACHYLCCEDRNEARCGCNDCPNPACRCEDEDEGRDPNDGDRTFDDCPPKMEVLDLNRNDVMFDRFARRMRIGFAELC